MTDQSSRRFIRPLRDFLATEAAGGFAVVVGAVLALVWANSPWRESYTALWGTELRIGLGDADFGLDLRHWVNEGLMTLFFLVVGMEIKREVVEGELRDRRLRVLPIASALGGMALPALIYLLINYGGPSAEGWGIPMATDVALAVGVLALAGRIPNSLKLFLLSLAIADDVGAIIVIAVFYGAGGNAWGLVGIVAVIAAVIALQRFGVESVLPYVGLGVILWICLRWAGVHGTIAGVILGLLAPTKPMVERQLVDLESLDPDSVEAVMTSSRLVRGTVSVVERMEYRLHGWSSYLVVPLFALANAGIHLGAPGEALASTVGLGVAVGLVAGKPIGILLFAWLATRLRIARLPTGTHWSQLVGVGLLAGIGFTVSLFIAELALAEPSLTIAKTAILAASLLAAIAGLAVLRIGINRHSMLEP
jgi:NhaA family Na+:H+ antiporter